MLAAVTALARLAEHVEECGRCHRALCPDGYAAWVAADHSARKAGLRAHWLSRCAWDGRLVDCGISLYDRCNSLMPRPVVVMRAPQRGA